VKVHTLLELRGSLPANVYVTGGQVHDINILDQLLPEAGAFYLLDRGYRDFARLYVFTQACAFFVTRARTDAQFYSPRWIDPRDCEAIKPFCSLEFAPPNATPIRCGASTISTSTRSRHSSF
jgi:Transposase DDE domain